MECQLQLFREKLDYLRKWRRKLLVKQRRAGGGWRGCREEKGGRGPSCARSQKKCRKDNTTRASWPQWIHSRSLALTLLGWHKTKICVRSTVLHSRIFRSGKSLWDFYIHPHSSRNRPPAIFLGEFFLVWPSFSASLSVQALFELLLPAKGHWVGGFYRRGREERGGPQPVAIRDQGGSNATTAKVFFFSSSRLLLL